MPSGAFDQRHYLPILKGKAAEFTALSHSTTAQRANFTPLVEIIPGEDEEDAREIEKALVAGGSKLGAAWGTADRVFVDTFLVAETVPLTGGRLAVQFLADQLRDQGVQSIPVGRLGSDPPVVAALSSVCRLDGRGLCLRLSAEDLVDPELVQLVEETLSDMGVAVSEVDLLVDRAEITGRLEKPARHLGKSLNRLADVGDWRSLTLAAGSFPADLSGQSQGQSSITRHDAALWRQVCSGQLNRVPAFGDYTIGHPLLAVGVAFAPAPQLRYTVDNEWLIWRGNKRNPRGSHQFYDHCAALVASGHFAGAAFSWGDGYIQRAAASATGTIQVGPGNPTTWRTVGVSHHIALVVNRLTTAGEP